MMENMSWDGSAAENIDKYQREVGVEKGYKNQINDNASINAKLGLRKGIKIR